MHLGRKNLDSPDLAFGSGGKHEIWVSQLHSRDAYTIFHHTRAENTTFAFLSRERKWHFRPGYGEKFWTVMVHIGAPYEN